jgi:hypothetical protein
MGILKHFVLPFFAVAHAVPILTVLIMGKQQLVVMLDWPGVDEERTTIERHLIGVLVGVQAVLLFGDLVGIFYENAHFRGIITAMELLFFTVDTYDNYVEGLDWVRVLVLSLIPLVGLIVHSREPGIFAKDKDKGKNN